LTKLIIKQEYQNIVYAPTLVEYNSMKQSIKSVGQYKPITVNKDLVILDGHNRYKICQELGIEPKYVIMEFPTTADEQFFVIETNLKRRHLNDFQIARLGYRLQELESEKARLRQLAQLNNNPLSSSSSSSWSNDHDGNGNSNNNQKGRTIEIISDRIGIPAKTYQRAVKIIEYGTEEAKKDLKVEIQKSLKNIKEY
jgi:ParB/Sulfiredoxin domain